MGSLVTNSKEQVKDEFEALLEVNTNNVHVLLLYGHFLIEVTNEELINVKYI